MSKKEQMIFAPEGTLLCLPEYEIRMMQAREGCAVFLLKKASKKLRGVKYETMIIDDPWNLRGTEAKE